MVNDLWSSHNGNPYDGYFTSYRLMTIPPFFGKRTHLLTVTDMGIQYMGPQLIGLYALAWLLILHRDLTIQKIIKCAKLETWELCAI
jgi:hypothetical protein